MILRQSKVFLFISIIMPIFVIWLIRFIIHSKEELIYSILLTILSISGIFSSLYLFINYLKSYIQIDDNKIIIYRFFKRKEVLLNEITNVYCEMFSNKIKSIDITYNNENLHLYGFIGLEKIIEKLSISIKIEFSNK